MSSEYNLVEDDFTCSLQLASLIRRDLKGQELTLEERTRLEADISLWANELIRIQQDIQRQMTEWKSRFAATLPMHEFKILNAEYMSWKKSASYFLHRVLEKRRYVKMKLKAENVATDEEFGRSAIFNNILDELRNIRLLLETKDISHV